MQRGKNTLLMAVEENKLELEIFEKEVLQMDKAEYDEFVSEALKNNIMLEPAKDIPARPLKIESSEQLTHIEAFLDELELVEEEAEIKLAKKLNTSSELNKDEIVNIMYPLLVELVLTNVKARIDFFDLLQEASIGLIEGIDMYMDNNKENDFDYDNLKKYLKWWILRAIIIGTDKAYHDDTGIPLLYLREEKLNRLLKEKSNGTSVEVIQRELGLDSKEYEAFKETLKELENINKLDLTPLTTEEITSKLDKYQQYENAYNQKPIFHQEEIEKLKTGFLSKAKFKKTATEKNDLRKLIGKISYIVN